MVNFTSKTYQMKREILNFSNKISRMLPKPERKFIADMNYGILASNSNHPVSLFSRIHSSNEKNFTSINSITFSAMERAAALFQKVTFVMDRGKASGYGSGQNVLHTVSSALSWLFKQRKNTSPKVWFQRGLLKCI